MNRMRLFLILLCVLATGCGKSTRESQYDQVSREIERIKASVMEYVEGVTNFDFSKGMNPWHPNGLKISYDSEENKLVRETILKTKPNLTDEEIEQAQMNVHQHGTIEFVDWTGDAAFVKLLWLARRGECHQEYTDYILLLRIQDEWKIVSKVSHSTYRDATV